MENVSSVPLKNVNFQFVDNFVTCNVRGGCTIPDLEGRFRIISSD